MQSYCPFCTRTKNAFTSKGLRPIVLELDERQDGAAIQAALLESSGQRTVPNVFFRGEHIGGNDDTQAAIKAGKFDDLTASEIDEAAEAGGYVELQIKAC